MEFCTFCDNMLYIRDSEENKFDVQYYCKHCGFKKQLSESNATTFVIKNMYNSHNTYTSFVNPELTDDPTIPHVDNIACRNPSCTRPEDKPNDVIYMKYDMDNIRFLYMCTYCNVHWRNAEDDGHLVD